MRLPVPWQCGLLLQAGLHSIVSMHTSLAPSHLIPQAWSCPQDCPSPLQVCRLLPEQRLLPGLHMWQTAPAHPLAPHEVASIQTPPAPQVCTAF